MSIHIGIDAGGTLIKVAYQMEDTIQYKKFSSLELENVVSWIKDHFSVPTICITGGKGVLLQSLLPSGSSSTITEFDATCKGIQFLLKSAKIMIDSYILTNVGTGTSIHYINADSYKRITGTGVGGGAMIGLSSLLTGIKDYTNIVSMAKTGKRDRIDLKVKDIYEDSAPPILGDLTASNFGKAHLIQLEHEQNDDFIASIIGLVGETVVTTSILAAEQYGVKYIVYIGSSFIDNEMLRNVVNEYTTYKGMNPLFINNGEYSGAIGALLTIKEIQ